MKKYFKKFSTMFAMTLILMLGYCVNTYAYTDDYTAIGKNNLNGTIANSAKVGNQVLQPEKGWKRYDDKNSKILRFGSFVDEQKSTFYKGSESYSNTVGDSYKFGFVGSKLRLYICKWKNRTDTNHIEVVIDGNTIGKINTYGAAVDQTLVFEYNTKNFSNHTVELVNIAPDGKYLMLDAIDIDDIGYLEEPSISLDKQSMNLTVDETKQLTATTTPAAVGVTWKSSDPLIATIEVDSTNGKIMKVNALKEGQVTITATTTDRSNLSASCIINVKPKGTNPNSNPTPDPQPTGTDNIVNIAHAKGDNTNNPGGGVTIIFHGTADTTLSVVKTADVKEVWVGDTFTYTIVVTNTGTKTAKAVVVNDPAPNHIDFVVNGVTTTQGTVDSSSTSKNIIVNVGDIPPLGTVTIKVPATVIL